MSELEFRRARPEERTSLMDLLETAFDERALFERYMDSDPALGFDETLVAALDGRIVSSVQIFPKHIRLGSETVEMGGIGSVACHPDFERRGIATQVLRNAIHEMRTRGMAISLLFTGRRTFYERLAWHSIPERCWSVHTTSPATPLGRPFEVERDLDAVREMYETYAARHNGPVVRDAAYWTANLIYAGEPDEVFRVVERGGRITAYARRADFATLARVIEHGCAEDGVADLADLLVSMAPDHTALVVHDPDEPTLLAELRARARRIDAFELPAQMWRVLDRRRLESIPGADDTEGEATLLRSLVGGTNGLYWQADRF